MKIKQLNLQSDKFQSFNIRRDYIPQYHNLWHYHEELELILILKGRGKLFVGDQNVSFQEDDLILIGANIPHYWLFENFSSSDQNDNTIDCIVIHFREDFLGNGFIHLHEASFLKELFAKAQLALHSSLPPRHPIRPIITRTLEQEGIMRVIALLETLHLFHQTSPKTLITTSYHPANQPLDIKRMNKIMTYIRENFTEDITLSDLAQLVQMTTSSFSRYFKQKTGQTAMQLIFELRIAYACNLLIQHDYSLKEICYESGFNNLVSFHKVFKKIKGTTPRTFRKNNLVL